MKILVVDNNIMADSWGAKDLVRCLLIDHSIEVSVRRAPQMDLPIDPRAYDRIVFSGSLTAAHEKGIWIEKHDHFLKQCISLKKRTLCICYGHQALGRLLGGFSNVGKSVVPEFGWTEIKKVGHSELFSGLNETFYSFSSHFDEVRQAPKGTKIIAQSLDCRIQGIELEDAPVWGIQFHPEKTLQDGEATLERRKKAGIPKKLLHAGKGEKFFDAQVASQIFKNFVKVNS